MNDQAAQFHSIVDSVPSGAKPGAHPRWKWIAMGVFCFAIGALAGVGLRETLRSKAPVVVEPRAFASRSRAEADLQAIRSAVDEFARMNGGKFPDTLQLLVTPDANGQTFLNRRSLPNDPWGRAYLYEPPGPGQPKPRVSSYGKDGQPGGEGDDADIDSLALRRER